jgi:hypothetical protein
MLYPLNQAFVTNRPEALEKKRSYTTASKHRLNDNPLLLSAFLRAD